MAGRGPAPKHASERRNKTAPARGEWVDLDPDFSPVLEEYPPVGEWSERTLAAWRSWRADPVGQVWSPADRGAVLDLAYLHNAFVGGDVRLAAELRLRMDGLGLTAKGKRDLRLRVAPAAEVVPIGEARSGQKSAAERMRELRERGGA